MNTPILTSAKNHALRETTVTATDAAGNFLCAETSAGLGARVAGHLSVRVRAAAERILRAERPLPRYGLVDVPGQRVQAVAFPVAGA